MAPISSTTPARRGWLAALLTALIVAAGISSPSAGAAGTATEIGPELTGFAASVLTRPSAVRGTDGRFTSPMSSC